MYVISAKVFLVLKKMRRHFAIFPKLGIEDQMQPKITQEQRNPGTYFYLFPERMKSYLRPPSL